MLHRKLAVPFIFTAFHNITLCTTRYIPWLLIADTVISTYRQTYYRLAQYLFHYILYIYCDC